MGINILLQNYTLGIVALAAFAIAYYAIPVIINVSHLKHLFDDPRNERKLHISAIPNLGGVGIFAAVVIVFALSGHALQSWSPYLAAGLTMLFFSGVKDDILVIGSYKKLFIQIAAVSSLIFGGNLVITDLGGVFGINQIPYWAGVGLTSFTMLVVINAYNLIDGIDGLAGGIGVIASLFFGWWFLQSGMMAQAVLSFALTGALLAFLRFNFEPASIFMGDTGSQVIGYLLGFFAVTFVSTGITTEVAVPFKDTVPVLVLSVLIVPLYDILRVVMVRVFRGNSPMTPDRQHVHHQLIDMGFSHRACCYIIYSFNFAIIALTLLLEGTEINLLFGIILTTAVVLFPTVSVKRNILGKLGIKMPSRREIQILEKKYVMPPKTIGTEKTNGHNKKNGHSKTNGHSKKSEEEYEEIAV